MADDILDNLTTYCLCSHVDYGWYYSVGGEGCPLCRAKAEIKRLRAENADILTTVPTIIAGIQNGMASEMERLRAAGDVLAEWAAVDHSVEQCEDGCEYFAALRVWQEARRG